MLDLQFEHANLLWITPIVVALQLVLVLLAFWLNQKARQSYGDPHFLDRFSQPVTLRSQLRGITLTGILLPLFVMLSAAGPFTSELPTQISAGNLQAIAVIDVDQGMNAPAYSKALGYDSGLAFFGQHGTALDEAKNVIVNGIMPSIPENQLGLVTYQSTGFPLAEPTDDYQYLRDQMENLLLQGKGGQSDVGAGLKLALDLFEKYGRSGSAKVIVLFSDGGQTGDSTLLAQQVERLKTMGVGLVIIGLNSNPPIPIPIYTSDGQFNGEYVMVNGAIAMQGIDESFLKNLAVNAGASYVHLDPGTMPVINWPSALVSVTKLALRRTLLYKYTMGAAIVTFVLIELQGSTPLLWLRKRRKTSNATAKKGKAK